MTWLDNARLFAIFAVMVVHVAVGAPRADMGTEMWVYNTSFDVLVRWCVPVFVMVSGALLLEPHAKESLRDFYKKRFSRIFVPILFWSLLYIVWGYFREDVQEPFTVSYVFRKLGSGLPFYHMWFMYMLLGLYAFTPVFRVIVAHMQPKHLMFFIAMAFGVETIQAMNEAWYVGESRLFLTWFLTYTPFFLMGYVVRHHDVPVSTPVLALITAGIAVITATSLCLVTLNTSHGEAGYFFKNLNIFNIFLSISLMFLFKRMTFPVLGEKLTGTLASLTFGIYLLHMIPLAYLNDLYVWKDYLNAMPSWAFMKDFWAYFSGYSYIPFYSFATLIVTGALVWIISRTPYIKRLV